MYFIVQTLLVSVLLCGGGCKSSQKTVHTNSGYTEARKQAEQERRRIVHESTDDLVREAERWLGTPYRYGGSEKGVGTDCSGLTMEIYRRVAGIKIPRNSAEQQKFCRPIGRDKLSAGDLVFFSSAKGRGGVSHVGIYVDEGVFVHASSSRGVIASNLSETYYDTHFHSAGRVPGLERKGRKSKPDEKRRAMSDPPKRKIEGSIVSPVLEDTIPVRPDTIHIAPVAAPAALPVPLPEEPSVESDSIRAQVRMAF